MPKVIKPEKEGGERHTATVQFSHVKEEFLSDGRAAMVFKPPSDENKAYLFCVNPDEPDVAGLCAGEPPEFATPGFGGVDVRKWLAENAIREPILVSARGMFIDNRACPMVDGKPTAYEGELDYSHAWMGHEYNKPDSPEVKALWMLKTDIGEKCIFIDAVPKMEVIKGDEPNDDAIRFDSWNRGKGVWKHAVALGLDWQRWQDEMVECDALWPREGYTSYYQSDDPVEWAKTDLPRIIRSHGGPRRVRWTMVVGDRGYVEPERIDRVTHMEPVVVQVSMDDQEWKEQRETFAAKMNFITAFVFDLEGARFVDDAWYMTDHGLEVAKNLISPILEQHPQLIGEERPKNHLTTQEQWPTDLFIALDRVAEVMLKHQGESLELSYAKGGPIGHDRHEALMEWLKTNPDARYYLEFEEVAL